MRTTTSLQGGFFAAFLVTLTLNSHGVVSDPFDVLNSRFSGVSVPLRSSAFGTGVYVAVGEGGTILTSTDTITWVPRVSGTTNRLNGVGFGNSGFVVVGEGPTGSPSTILNSVDGVNWVQCTSPVTNALNAVCHLSGRYVAVGSSGVILTSTNGNIWTSIFTGAPYDLNGVAGTTLWNGLSGEYNDIFVAVGDSGGILTSPDGLAWTGRFSGLFDRLNAISILPTYGPFVVVGNSGTVAISNDGSIWTKLSSGTTADLYGVANDSGTSLGGVPNGGRFGAIGAGGVFLLGMNGTTWISGSSSTSNNLLGTLYTDGNFLAVGEGGAVQAGISWLRHDVGTNQSLSYVCYGNGTFVAVGAQGAISSSTNGFDWNQRVSGVTNTLNAVCYGTNHFVVVGNGTILNSIDGSGWTLGNISPTNNLLAIAYGNGVYVALGNCLCASSADGVFGPIPTGFALQSPDGINWNGPYFLPPPSGFQAAPVVNGAIAFATNTFFVTLYPYGQVITSSDGINWTNQNLVATNLVGVVFGGPMAYGESGYVAASGSSFIRTSPDDVNWVWRPIENLTFSVAFGNGSYVLLCDDGVIRRSTPLGARAQPLLAGGATGSGFKLSMTAQPGYSYTLQRTAFLESAVWTNVYSFTGTQAVTTYVDSAAINQSVGLYRVISP